MHTSEKFRTNESLIIISALLLATAFAGTASAATLTVNASGGMNYTSIQDAINNASAGDTIIVQSGIYYENVNVNKQLMLLGVGTPVVDAGGVNDAITLSADGIMLEGFSVTNATGYMGIRVASNNNTITGVNASNNYYGIYLYSSNNNNITGSNASYNGFYGIYLDYSSNNTLAGNTASKDYYGIYLYYSNNNSLIENDFSNNIYYDIYLDYLSNNNILIGNEATNSNYGIYMYYSNNNNLTANNFSNNNNGYGIYLYSSSNNNLTGNDASNNYYGISAYYSSNNNLSSNNFSNNNNGYGIYLYSSSNNNLTGNNASNNYNGIYAYYSANSELIANIASNNSNGYGIYLYSSDNSAVEGNIAGGNTYGISIYYSSNDILSNNLMEGNTYNFYLTGSQDSQFNNTIDTSNMVDGKPLYYVTDSADAIYDSSSNPGTFYCIRCNNVTIKDVILTKNYYGVFFWNTYNSTIQNISASNNYDGIYLSSSNYNIISGNNASNNYEGIYIYFSGSNNVTSNVASNNVNGYGIYLYSSSNNNLAGNNASDNYYGISMYYSSNNDLTANIASDNINGYGIYLYSSGNNIIRSNNVSNSYTGIYVYYSSNNNLSDNVALNNINGYGIYLYSSDNSIINRNNASGNSYGISIDYSSSDILSNNLMTGNVYNFYVTGYQDSHFDHTIDTSNKVDGKPIYYLKNSMDTILDSSSNPGTFYCIKCNNVTIKDAVLTKNYYGIFFWNTYGSTIQNIDSSSNYYGIYFSSSGNNNITGSSANNNSYGIYFSSSGNNNITGSSANNNSYGIYFSSSNNNNITGSSASSNSNDGIDLYYSSGNLLNDNMVVGNPNLDFNVYSSVNSGDNNTCDKPDGWNDNGVIGCRYLSRALSTYPDFTVTDITWSPSSFNISDTVALNADVMNLGPGDFTGYLSVGFYVDGVFITQANEYASLNASQAVNFTAYWTVDKGGANRTITAVADYNNYWAEVNETNNAMNVTVPRIGGPDLIVDNITWSPSSFSANQYVTFTATIKNIGDQVSPSTYNYVGFFIDGNYISTNYAYGSIAPNDSLTVTSYSWLALPGNHTVKATADYYNYVAETNETNNDLSIDLPYADYPDLIVENITWSPSPYSAGQYVTFTATIRNIGNGSSPSTYNYVRFFIDGNYISENYFYGSVAPNSSFTVTSYAYAWTGLPGNHTVKATADYYNYVSESNETNNDLSVALPYTPGPDLIVQNITWSPSTYSANQYVTFTATIENIGDGSSSQYSYVGFYIDGTLISTYYMPGSLAPNASLTVTSSWQAKPGNHTVKAYADVYNYVAETNETNNDLSIMLPYTPGPDLIVQNISWSPYNYSPGDTITFSANVTNIGDAPTGIQYQYVGFLIDGNSIGYNYVYTDIAVGQNVTIPMAWTAQGGNHTLEARADYFNYINELNETNNANSTILPFVALPDLVITNLSWTPFNYSAGDPITLNATVENIGSGNWDGPVYVIFYHHNTTYISSVNPSMILPSGGVGYATVTWQAQAGDFYFRTEVDPYNYIIESNESNNNFYVRSNNVPLPDLTVDDIKLNVEHMLIPRGDQNDNVFWKYINITPDPGWQNFSFDDSNWSTGKSPFGDTGNYRTYQDLACGQAYFRKIINTKTPVNSTFNLYIASDDGVDVWVNGAQALNRSTDLHGYSYWSYQVDITPYMQQGDNILAIYLKDGGCGSNYFDAEITNTTTTPPESAIINAGDSVTINATIKNIGPGNLSSWYFYNYLYIDGSSYTYTFKTMSLPVNGTDYVTFSWTATPGTHSIRVLADAGNYINEANENNNDKTVLLSPIAYPDLVIDALTWSPLNYTAGQTVTLIATIRNAGTGYVGQYFYTRFFIDGSYLTDVYHPGIISPGDRITLSTSWTAQGGSHTLRAYADIYNYIPEVNETNNDLTVSLTPVLPPDLIISGVTASTAGVTANVSDINPSDGALITFNATMMNIGTGNISATNLYVGIYIDGVHVTDGVVNQALPVNGTANIQASWYATPGNHTFLARADPYNYMLESNESNNDFSATLAPILFSDLTVSSITWTPSNFSDGQLVTFNAIVGNIGMGNTSRSFYTRFLIDGNYIGEQYLTGGIASGSSATVTQGWIATPGEHKIMAIADVYGQVAESNESNNTLELNLTRVDLPDLTVSNLSWTPSAFTDGQVVTFNATIANIGKGNTTRAFYNRFLIDGAYIGEQYLPGLESGSSVNVIQTWAATPGQHTIEAIADVYNYVTESNETNNTLVLNLTMVDRPDLTVSSIEWTPSNFSDGQVVTFNATIANIGVGNTTRTFYTRFLIDGSFIGERPLVGLVAGASTSITQAWTATPGEHNITVIADYYNQVSESSESNNSLVLNLTKVDQPDLTVSNLTWNPSTFSDGQVVTFNATIANTGAGNTTRAFYTRFLIDGIYIGEQYLAGGLASGTSTNIVQNWIATPGQHNITAVVDIYNYVAESNESNNALVIDLPRVDQPDLIISNLNWTHLNFSDGQAVTFNAIIQNTGPGNTARGFWTRFLLDNVSIGEQIISGGLASGSSTTLSQSWTATPGEHTIEAVADVYNQVSESNETNNTLLLNLTKIDPPDLVVSSITWTPLNFSDGQVVTFNATVQNIGAGSTTRVFYTGFLIDDVSIGERSLSGLVSNSSATRLQPWIATPGPHKIKVAADVHNTVAESNETNNNITMGLPAITFLKPDSTSRWSGTQMIAWTIDLLNSSSTTSAVYYWKPFAWAPSFLENSTVYFTQGSWILLTSTANTSFLWDTTGFSGYTRIKIVATDGTYTTTRLSDVFIVNNRAVIIELGNYHDPGGNFLTTQNPVIFGVVDATLINITQININSSDFNLTRDPAGKTRGLFEFRSNLNYSGTFSVSLTAFDEAGNTGNLSASFLVDPVPPVINSAGFANLFTQNPVSITVNATDDRSIAEVDLTSFGQTLQLNLSADGLYHGTVLAPAAAGSYPAQIHVQDSAGNLNSTNYTLEILSGPDLEINASGIFFDPSTIITGAQLNITAQINNVGFKSVDAVNVTFLADNQSIGSLQGHLSISPNVTMSWQTTGFAGNVTIGARIENSTNYTEIDYSNNNASRVIFIDGPDLTVANMAFNPPSPVYAGQVVTITATVENLRPIDANNVRITFYQNAVNLSNRIDFRDVNVPANSTVDVSVNWQTGGLPGIQTVFVEANTKDLPAEVDLSNNILNSTFETKPYIAEQIPDLLTFPQKQLAGIPGEKVRGMASNDFNGDNKTDFVVGTDKGTIMLYRNNGKFYTNNNKTKNVNFTQVLIDNIGEGAEGMTSADLYGDGYPDLIVGTESGRIIFYNNSNGVFTDNVTLLDAGDWAYGLAASDFNNDNKFDLVIGNKVGQVNLYLNNMTGNNLTNESMVFNMTLTTRDLPFGLTTGDFDRDGHVDVMVGDRLGQIERIVYENGHYQGFLFADVGAFAHGLTSADVDYNGGLDLFTISFDGNVRMFFDREGGLVANPLVIGNVPQSFGLTSGDYDSDNDVDLIVGSDNGNVTMLMNSLRIIKSSTPLPSPPRRNIEVETQIQNPWAREMIDTNLTEMWQDNVSFVKGAYPILLGCDPFTGECTYFYADMFLFETPRDNSTYKTRYYLQFPNTVCKQTWTLRSGRWSDGCQFFNYNGEGILQDRSLDVSNPLGIFDGLDLMRLREGFKYRYKFFPESVTDVSAITNLNYSLLGAFNTPNTSFLLSDDVTNLNDITANSKNINPSRIKSDRDYTNNLVIAPDFTPVKLEFTDYTYPPVPNELVTVRVTINNLNNIAINDVKVMFLIDDVPVQFGCPRNCQNYTIFNIGALGSTIVSVQTRLSSSVGGNVNVAVFVNPLRDDLETNYDNNNITNSIATLPPSDISNDRVYFGNGSVLKNVFTEGEPITVFTNISNIGTNRSFSENVYFLGFNTVFGYTGIVPVNRVVSCAIGSPDYDANLCSGSLDCRYLPCTSPGNLDPGESITTNMSSILGDFKVRSMGTYNFTTIVTNVGSLDQNHDNDANVGQFVVLPSQEDLLFDPFFGLYLSNSNGNNITFQYMELDAGGIDISNYDSIIYLDNNDSNIVTRLQNESLANHTSNLISPTIDWSSVPPGDHEVDFYLDYGKNDSESTAKATSSDGLIYISNKPGVSGNDLAVSVQNRELLRTRLATYYSAGSTTITVDSVSGFNTGDRIKIEGETYHDITDMNATSGTLTITPALNKFVSAQNGVFIVLPDIFNLTITKTTEIVEQIPDFDLRTRTDTQSFGYNRLSDNVTDIRTLGDIVDVIQNGGYNLSGYFIPSGLLYVDASGANLSARPAAQSLELIIPGSLTHERSDFNNQNRIKFRWKEIIAGGITFNPIFPSPRDVVAISSTISNSGDIATEPFNVSIYINGQPYQTQTISLLAHESKPVSYLFTIPPKSDKLSYDVRIFADSDNVIMHEDESNNNATATIPVSAPFELNILARDRNINFLSSYLNNGNVSFTSTTSGLENTSMEYDAVPVFVDYNNDSVYDMIVGSLDGKLRSFRNTGTNTNPAWTETDWSDIDWKTSDVLNVNINGRNYQTVSISMLDVGARSAPEFVDLDNDTLADMVIGDAHGRLRSFKRVIAGAQVLNPQTGSYEFKIKRTWVEYDFNLSKVSQALRAVPRFSDLDGDGDYDLIVGNQFGKLVGYENIGNSSDPDWMQKDFNLSGIDVGTNAAPAVIDLNSDGLPDLIVGSGTGISVFENTGSRTNPAWQKLNFSLSLPGIADYKPALADLNNDGNPDLVFGSNNLTRLELKKGYFEPVNVQLINYAKNQIDIARIELMVMDGSSGNKITDLFQDGPFNQLVPVPPFCGPMDMILRGNRIEAQGAIEKEYDLDIPAALPDNAVLAVRATKQENVNPAYFYELGPGYCGQYTWLGGAKGAPIYINRPELGGNTFDLFVDPGATYEISGSYSVYFNGTMSRQYTCSKWCPIYNLTDGEINTIVGSGEIRRLTHLTRTDFDIVKPDVPPITLSIYNKIGLELKPGYIEDIDVSVTNNNRRQYIIDRIAIELFDQGIQTGNRTLGNATVNVTVPTFGESRIISLFTDTSGFTLPPQQTTQRRYKVYIPDGVPLGSMLLVKGVEKRPFSDDQYDRSNINELWPASGGQGDFGGNKYGQDIARSSLYNSTILTLFTDPYFWGKQNFDFGNGCFACGDNGYDFCGPEESFLRKHVWIPRTLIKSEQKEVLTQICTDQCVEPPSGVTSWVEGGLKSSLVTECGDITYGWTPNYDKLDIGKNNEFDLYSFGPHRQFDITLYDSVAFDYMPNTTVEPIPEAFALNIRGIGNHGLLRRQYEEQVNVTVTNNDDDPVTVDAITLSLITPQNNNINLLTDTKSRLIPPESQINLTYLVLIPSDVPLGSTLTVQVERVFEFADKLWNRDHESNLSNLLAAGTEDYHWGDTLPTGESSKYRKHFFAPRDVTRAEMILGDTTFTTDAYLNGEFQGSGYPGWSPISISSGMKQGQENLLSIVGAIPDTESRIYSGSVKTGGSIIQPEEDVYFAVFGIREKQFIPDREPFFVLPGESVTARIRVENKYNKTLNFAMRLYVVDFNTQSETTVATQTLTVLPYEIKNLEVDLTIPNTVSNQTRLELSSVWNELLSDKNWLRGSNFHDEEANNKFLNDSQWGVVEVGPANERAIYFRKHLWIDSTVQGISITKSGVDKMWVNGLEVAGDVLKNEFTKSDSNLITLKATNFDVDADIMLDHFVPVRSTDLDFRNLNYSYMFIMSQANQSFDNQSLYDCSNQTLGECIFAVDKGEKVKLNFTLRNAGELFARNFNLKVSARNVATGAVTEFYRETITMHPFSMDDWNVTLDTGKLSGGMYEFVVFADADDVIIETSEFNNKAVRNIYVNANPEVRYLDSQELQGYNENVSISAEILDEDGNLNITTLAATGPDNIPDTLNLSGSGDIFSALFNTTEPGRYRLNLTAIDALGKAATGAREFDIFDSLYLNVKTEKDVYYYTQTVSLTQAKVSNLTKHAPNSAPVLVNVFGNVNEIKGGDRLTIGTGAFDPDGDLITLYVCKSNQAGSSGCLGGTKQTYCNSTGFLNPSCSFNTERDDKQHQWFAFLVDEKGLMDGPVAGNYTTDSTPPVTRFYSLASDKNNLVDIQKDSKTIITIQGEPGMSCRFGKDPLYRFHKDRSYSLLENDCTVSGGFANCNLGDLKKDDPSRDKITNLTRAYVSCQDASGNEQENIDNVAVEFEIDPVTSIFDDYQGNILAPGSNINISGETYFCVDDTGRCMPNKAINNGSVAFLQPGVFHLMYIDAVNNIKDTTVFVNSRPYVSEQTFIDHFGEHAFDVRVMVSDPDDQTISCTLTNGTSTRELQVESGIAKTTLTGSQGQTITTQVSCNDGIESVSTSLSSHTFPNQAPQLRNIPDISLDSNETSIIDMSYFGFDLENDTLTYTIVSQSDTGIANASLSSNVLTVIANTPGVSSLCLKDNDGLADSNAQCISIFMEDGSESKLKNNELANTTVRLLMQVQYFDGTWQNESSKEIKLRILPGSANQIDLSRFFGWNSSTSSRPEGLFRVLFRAVDDNNNTLINRDGKEIHDSYNFTLKLFNIPPNLTGIPDQTIFENQQLPSINLADYTIGTVKNIEDLEYAIVNQTNSSLINCSIMNGHFISCITAQNQTGTSELNVSVFDGFVYSFDAFAINVIPFEEFVRKGNLTYTFISDRFNVSGNPFSGARSVFVSGDTPPGTYNITVIVSDGALNISKNITVTVTAQPTYQASGYVLDNFDTGLSGWTVNLTKPDGTVVNDITDSLGRYQFFNLANGTYNVTEVLQTGWTNVSSLSIQVDIAGTDVPNQNFTNILILPPPRFSISGFKINGTSNNGTSIPGWPINLTMPDGTVVTTATDANGMYQFMNLLNGNYTVTELMQNGWMNTTPMSILVDVNGIDKMNQNFTNALVPAQAIFNISGFKINGTDNNGTGIPGWTINLTKPDGTVVTTATDANGMYQFTNLLNGNYTVKEVLQTGWTNVTSLSMLITIAGADVLDRNFTNTLPPAQVTGLTNGTPTQTTINLSWDPISDANYYQVFRNGSSLGYTRNTYWNDTGLTPDTIYEYVLRANDSYNNWGPNSSSLFVRTAPILDITPPASITNLVNVSYAQEYINWTWNDPADLDFYRVIVFIDGILKDYVLKGVQFYNATGFEPDTVHTISTRTEDTSGNLNQTWENRTTMTAPVPAYQISGYVFDNYGNVLKDVLVQNGSYNATTLASGYYSISVPNGTYNFSYTRTGFNPGYLVVSIVGEPNNSANITIYDTTPPAQVTGLKNDTPTQTTVNLSWNPVSDANYYQVFRNGSSLGYTRNTYWNDTGLTPDTLFVYVVRANDSYNNWGLNSSSLNVRTKPVFILTVTVRIEPETLNLANKGEFTAFINLPSGYDVSNIKSSTVVCEGAPIVKWNIADDKTFIAKFNRQDLVNVKPGNAIKFTVTGKLIDGTPFKGSDVIRVIK